MSLLKKEKNNVVRKLPFRDLHRTWPVGSARIPLVDL